MSTTKRRTCAPSSAISHVVIPGGGAIGIMAFPGFNYRMRDIQEHGVERAPDADLRRVREWGASTLITLVEKNEMDDVFRVPDLRSRAKAAGLKWVHCPIPDMDCPGSEFNAAWSKEWRSIRRTLSTGGQVVVHCAAGRGRAGTVAARILIAFGIPADDAIRSVRNARPDAIESRVQEKYLRSLKK